MKVAIDVGYSQVKAIAENGRKVIFPSVKAPMISDPTGGMFKKLGHEVTVNSRTELVGEAALRSMTAITTLDHKKPDELHDLFILTALYLCGVSNETQLAVGLPLAFYRSQRDSLKARLQGLNASVQIDGDEEKHISISSVDVYPQGAGVLLANGLSFNKRNKVAVIDIGYYTTDFLIFEQKSGLTPIADLCGSVDSGVHLISKGISSIYQEKTGSFAPKFLLNDILQDKPIYFKGNPLNLSSDFSNICNNIATKITQEISSVWGREVNSIEQTILAGGGSLLLNAFLNFPNITVPTDPVFANTEGFLYMLSVSHPE